MSFFSPSKFLFCMLLLAFSSHCQTPDTCEVANTTVFRQICSNVSSVIEFTQFPNVHGHFRQSDADSELFTHKALVSSECDIDVELFICLYYFPTCREAENQNTENVPVVQPPCRDFCLRIQAACESDISADGSVLDCSILPMFNPAQPTSCYDPYHLIVINRVSNDFVNFWDYGMKGTILDSFTIVFFFATGNVYESFDLTGKRTLFGYLTVGLNGPGLRPFSHVYFSNVVRSFAVALYRTKRQEYTYLPESNSKLISLATVLKRKQMRR